MAEGKPAARSSLVPLLGLIALGLFGLNFYTYLSRQCPEAFGRFPCDVERFEARFEHIERADWNHRFLENTFQELKRQARAEIERCERTRLEVRGLERLTPPPPPQVITLR